MAERTTEPRETTGDLDAIDCPHCGKSNTELGDTNAAARFYSTAGDSVECQHCEADFVVSLPEPVVELEGRAMEPGYQDSRARFTAALEQFRVHYATYTLTPFEVGKEVQSYCLADFKQGRTNSTLIIFSPEGITLLGDLVPKTHGVSSRLGYGAGWFAGNLGPDYLVEKFADVESRSKDHALLCAIQERFAEQWGQGQEVTGG